MKRLMAKREGWSVLHGKTGGQSIWSRLIAGFGFGQQFLGLVLIRSLLVTELIRVSARKKIGGK